MSFQCEILINNIYDDFSHLEPKKKVTIVQN